MVEARAEFIENVEKPRKRERGRERRRERAQAAVEFMAITALLGLMLLVIYFISFNQGSQTRLKKEWMDGFAVCEAVAAEINNAVTIGDGYSHKFFLPYYVGETTNYSIAFVPVEQAIEVSWGNYQCRLLVLSSSVSGTPRQGENLVKNEDGVVVFE